MEFDKYLIGKILDPIHGIIRFSELERQFIKHPLFQRLRSIKQNTFLYKVFPSAMHTRFEHSLGVMHLAYEIIKNLQLNSYRYIKKYSTAQIFDRIGNLPVENIQELRLAALLHDIGHGPMSHQFDSFMCKKEKLKEHLGDDFPDVFKMIEDDANIEHEHISILFVKIIYNSLDEKFSEIININIDNVIKIIEPKYLDKEIMVTINNNKLDELPPFTLDVLPLFTSVISSCPIDADRMDYLLRDSYFTGVTCGVYDYNRLFMSIVPVMEDDKEDDKLKLFLAYKESGLDSVVEFINSRSSLYGQVYYHKTNRAFSAMLALVCDITHDIAKQKNPDAELNLFAFDDPEPKSAQLENFYIKNSDEYFLHKQLPKYLPDNANNNAKIASSIINDIIKRAPWSKIYESKIYPNNTKIGDLVNKHFTSELKDALNGLLAKYLQPYTFAIDIMTDNAFKDIDKTKIKLLVKNLSGTYDIKEFSKSGDKLDKYQSIKYFLRIFVPHCYKSKITDKLRDKIQQIELKVVKEHNIT